VSSIVPLLAHIGSPNNPWIGVMTIAAAALVVMFMLVAFRAVTMEAPGDMLLPFAVVVLLAGLAGSLGDAINDQGPWVVPVGVVALIALTLSAFRGGIDFSPKRSAFAIVVVVALAVSLSTRSFLEGLWFPNQQAEVFLPERGDATATLELLSPVNENGTFRMRLTVTGGTLGTMIQSGEPDDTELDMVTRWLVGPVYLVPPVSDACAADEACTSSEFEITLPAGFVTEPPERVTVELLSSNGLPFATPLTASIELRPAD
jgi:hypothetical protein